MPQYKLILKTGDVHGAGTDARVRASIRSRYQQSRWFDLDKPGYDDFEQGDLDGYVIQTTYLGGDPEYLNIEMDMSGLGAAWYLDWVIVEEIETGKKWKGTPTYHWFDVEYSTNPYEYPSNTTSQSMPLERDDSIVVPRKKVYHELPHGGGYVTEEEV
ncbi:PLAT/LH2 domain-containing protein [Nocardia suismassiliense]|uniref:PLAT/LH2 domain-containing protein n=1 Tax=Nocardia suismassiliense TaxID=2077092 RepID=UPI000D1E83FB|nr:PLAT/LH2 domain-containing protein [Nocardia suismassiliense]